MRFWLWKSIFNTVDKGKYIIFDITFKLAKNGQPNLEYRDLKNRFVDKVPSLIDIRQAVIEIRDKKASFPVEAKKGNAGSFFKNPVLTAHEYQDLQTKLVVKFGQGASDELGKKKFIDNRQTKVPAAFLIELCGLKDLKSGGAAINKNQPLVIINQTGQATAKDVLDLANKIKAEVLLKAGIELKFEPELIGF